MKARARIIAYTLICIFTICVLLYPTRMSKAISGGLNLYAVCILPSLLPFFVLTALLEEVGVPRMKRPSGITNRLFNSGESGAYVTLISTFAGYPSGARLIAGLGADTQTSESIFAHTSLPGPAFVIGTVGAGMLHDTKLGMLLWVIQLLATFISGLIFRAKENTSFAQKNSRVSGKGALSRVTSSAVSAALNVGLFTALSSGVIEVLFILNIPQIIAKNLPTGAVDQNMIYGAISCVVEMSNGVAYLSKSSCIIALPAISFAMAFGGACIAAQSLSMCGGKVRTSRLLLIKLCQGSIAFAITALLCLLGIIAKNTT